MNSIFEINLRIVTKSEFYVYFLRIYDMVNL